MLVLRPMIVGSLSARITALNQTLAPLAKRQSPITRAPGAIQTEPSSGTVGRIPSTS